MLELTLANYYMAGSIPLMYAQGYFMWRLVRDLRKKRALKEKRGD